MKKVLFLIHDLGQGGAEKVLVNLVNNMDKSKFDITIISLFGGGVNEQFLNKDVHYRAVFPRMIPGNSKWMKLFTPKQLHRLCVKEHYDIEISYLEGPSARVVSGCADKNTKLVSWIHSMHHNKKNISRPFRGMKEAKKCYERFDNTICVSEEIRKNFCEMLEFKGACEVLYNTVESDKIIELSHGKAERLGKDDTFRMIAVGTLKEVKGYDRLLRIVKRLQEEQYEVHLYILGKGPQQKMLEKYIEDNSLNVTLLGYDVNPYRYVAKCDLFVCSSYSEGFSTAVTEALIVGTPVVTTLCSGMQELLGANNEYGIVTENNEEALYEGIKKILDTVDVLQQYREKACERGKKFCTAYTVQQVEKLFVQL